jgi:hypothetical protein
MSARAEPDSGSGTGLGSSATRASQTCLPVPCLLSKIESWCHIRLRRAGPAIASPRSAITDSARAALTRTTYVHQARALSITATSFDPRTLACKYARVVLKVRGRREGMEPSTRREHEHRHTQASMWVGSVRGNSDLIFIREAEGDASVGAQDVDYTSVPLLRNRTKRGQTRESGTETRTGW